MSYPDYDPDKDERTLQTLAAAGILILLAVLLSVLVGCATLDATLDKCLQNPSACVPAPPPSLPPTTLPAPVPIPTPEPSPVPSVPPPATGTHGQDDPWPELSGRTQEEGAQPLQSFTAALNRAIDVACGACPNGTVLEDWEAFVRAVRDRLRSTDGGGFRASYDWGSAEAGGLGSELSFWRGCRLESHQIVTTAKRVRRPAGSFRGEGTLELCTAECPLQFPLQGYRVGLRLGRYGQSQQFDGTPFIIAQGGAIPPVGWTGACRVAQCDLAPDKDWENGPTCTRTLCGSRLEFEWIGDGELNWTNGYRAKVTVRTNGVLKACCPLTDACASLPIAVSP